MRNNSRWYPFICLQSFIRTKKLTGRCDRFNQGEKIKPEFENIQKLFQLSLVLLYDRCILNKEKIKYENPLCNEISNGKVTLEDLIIVKGDYEVSELIREDDEADEEFSLRVLGLLQYQYNDLGLTKKEAPRASYLMQKNLYNSIEGVVRLQPQPQRAILSLGLKPAVNLLGYYPPSSYAYFEIGTYMELGYSSDFVTFNNTASPIKLNVGIMTQGHESILTGGDNTAAFTPSAGLSLICIR